MYDLSIGELERRASAGDHEAQVFLGTKYARGEKVDRDYDLALFWYLQAAAGNYPLGKFNIGGLYARGCGVKKDISKALVWFRQAADDGDMYCQRLLASFYENGIFVETNIPEAIHWYVKAADQGELWAQWRLWALDKKGVVPEASERAKYWAQCFEHRRANEPKFVMKYTPSEVSQSSGSRAFDPESGQHNIPATFIDS